MFSRWGRRPRLQRVSRPAARATAVVTFCCFLISCSGRAPRESLERLAILPFENLTNSTDLDWISALSAAILAYDLTGPRNIHPIRVDSIGNARLSRAGREVQGYFAREHGVLVFHATIANRTIVVSASAYDVASAMNHLAKDLSPDARVLTGCDAAAQHLYGEVLQGRSGPDSVTQAGGCAPVYLQTAEVLLARGDREGAARVCAAALALPKLDRIDRAQFDFVRALAQNDSSARLRALQNLAAVLPSDPDLLRNIAEQQFANRQFQAAVKTFESATRADPGDAQAWNDLGYARATVHDLAGARDALEHYQKLLPPENVNGLDSLGEVSFFLADFAAAERYFLAANQKNPDALGGRELLKAAEARMMTGDLAGADRILARLSGLNEIERAEWEFITGRRQKAISRLQALPQNPALQLQLAIWNAQTGKGPPPAAGDDPLSRVLSPLLSGHFREAVPALEQLYRATNPGADGQVRTLLAWAYAGSGQTGAAAKLLDLYPIPLASGAANPLLASLVFPRFVQLRAELLHSPKDAQLARMYD